jgi:hypothetical protein
LQIRGVRIAILVFVIFYETRIVVNGRHLVWLGHGGFDLAGGRHSTGGSKLSGQSGAEREKARSWRSGSDMEPERERSPRRRRLAKVWLAESGFVEKIP